MIKMATKNDDRIIELKKQIEAKKDELKNKSMRFQPDTNCILVLDNITYNINVLPQDELRLLAIKLNLFRMSAEDLYYDVSSYPVICGYTITKWLHDVNNKIDVNTYYEERKKLNKLEKDLTALLSNEKQTELKIDELAKILG